jgi:hypothetical protein
MVGGGIDPGVGGAQRPVHEGGFLRSTTRAMFEKMVNENGGFHKNSPLPGLRIDWWRRSKLTAIFN